MTRNALRCCGDGGHLYAVCVYMQVAYDFKAQPATVESLLRIELRVIAEARRLVSDQVLFAEDGELARRQPETSDC